MGRSVLFLLAAVSAAFVVLYYSLSGGAFAAARTRFVAVSEAAVPAVCHYGY